MTVNELIRGAIECPRESPRYAFIAPYLKQAKDIAWDYAHKFAGAIPGVGFNEAELRVDLPGDRRLRLYGADNPDSIQGIYLDGVVMDEYQLTAPWIFRQIIRPMLADRKGWIIFAGKPRGRNHFFDLYRAMQAQSDRLVRLYRASETGYVDPDELADMKLDMTPEEYAQEMECSFDSAVVGAYYARELTAARESRRIRPVAWEPAIPVETWWDVGYTDATAILFVQRVGRELHVIDYLEDAGKDLAFYAKALQGRPYLYGKHHLPHDAGHSLLASAGKSIAELLRALDVKPLSVHQKNDPLDGINQARLLFPRVWFDEVKCERLLACLAHYHAKQDLKNQTERPDPEHDWSSHGADAFRYLAVGTRLAAEERPAKPAPAKATFSLYAHFGRPVGRAR